MYYINDYIHLIFPIFTLFLLFAGLRSQRKNYLLAALWLSLIAIVLHYQTAGGEILGSYFDYKQAAIYTINFIVLLVSFICLMMPLAASSSHKSLRLGTGFLSALLIAGVTLLLINIWFNAYFLSDRMPGTPLLQVATFKKLDYCNYRYVFYKVSEKGKVSYMCPNYYGLIPSQGYLSTAPDYVIRQLPMQLQEKFKQVDS